MMPTEASFAKTVNIGSGHSNVVQLSGGTSYRKRLRNRKRRAAKKRAAKNKKQDVQLHHISVKAPRPTLKPAPVPTPMIKLKPAMQPAALLSSKPDMQGAVVPVSLKAASSTDTKTQFTGKVRPPRKVYEAYVAEIKAGHDTEKVMMSYLSEKKKIEMMAALNKSEKMRTFGLKFIAKVTQCTDLTFMDQKITGNKAVVSYKGKDICSKKHNPYVKKTERVEMIKENGRWKIEISSSGDHDLILHKSYLNKNDPRNTENAKTGYTPSTIYESYAHLLKKEDGFKDAAEFFATKQKKASLLKLFNHPKEVSDQTLKAVAKSAECTQLKLVSEEINNGTATLKYAAKDYCSNNAQLDRFETVELLKVQGFWKVDKITVRNH